MMRRMMNQNGKELSDRENKRKQIQMIVDATKECVKMIVQKQVMTEMAKTKKMAEMTEMTEVKEESETREKEAIEVTELTVEVDSQCLIEETLRIKA